MSTPIAPKQRNPWALAGLGLAIVVLTVNVTFVVISSSTNPGLVTEDYQKYGMQQFSEEVQMREQEKRGWNVNLNIPQLVQNQNAKIVLNVMDAENVPVQGAKAELVFYRPSDSKLDEYYELVEDKNEKGKYFTTVNVKQKGTWDINLLVDHQGSKHRLAHRIQVIDKNPKSKTPTLLEKIVNLIRS